MFRLTNITYQSFPAFESPFFLNKSWVLQLLDMVADGPPCIFRDILQALGPSLAALGPCRRQDGSSYLYPLWEIVALCELANDPSIADLPIRNGERKLSDHHRVSRGWGHILTKWGRESLWNIKKSWQFWSWIWFGLRISCNLPRWDPLQNGSKTIKNLWCEVLWRGMIGMPTFVFSPMIHMEILWSKPQCIMVMPSNIKHGAWGYPWIHGKVTVPFKIWGCFRPLRRWADDAQRIVAGFQSPLATSKSSSVEYVLGQETERPVSFWC